MLPVLLAGCINEELAKTEQVPSSLFGNPTPPPAQHVALTGAPASVEAASRVDQLGRKLIGCNPQMGLKPVFASLGDPRPEITNRLDPAGTPRIYVTEGLVRQCRSDGELAAVLSLELGKMVAQRKALAALSTRMPDRQPPPDVRISTGAGRWAPLMAHTSPRWPSIPARAVAVDRRRCPPDPRVLARGYLEKAGFNAADLDAVEPTLRQAEQNLNWEKQFATQPARSRAGRPILRRRRSAARSRSLKK